MITNYLYANLIQSQNIMRTMLTEADIENYEEIQHQELDRKMKGLDNRHLKTCKKNNFHNEIP